MKTLLTKSPLIIKHFFVQTLSLLLMGSAGSLSIGFAQQSTPMKSLTPVRQVVPADSDFDTPSISFQGRPSAPLFLETIGTQIYATEHQFPVDFTTGEVNIVADRTTARTATGERESAPAENEATFAIEPAEMAFEIGKKVDFEGLRVANIDPYGHAILMEDLAHPVLYIRFQKITTGYIDATLYNESGALVLNKKTMNIMCGTEFQLDYSQWAEGAYTLHVRLDNGNKWTKKIVKTAATAGNF